MPTNLIQMVKALAMPRTAQAQRLINGIQRMAAKKL
jgi:hypothetical protein